MLLGNCVRLRRVFFWVGVALVLTMTLSVVGCGAKKDLVAKEILIATGARTGSYFPVGEVIARTLKEQFPTVHVQVLETDGSVQNMNLLQEGKANLALVQSDIANYAVQGKNMFIRAKVTGVTGLAPIFPEVVQLISRRADNLTSIKALKGKKIGVGTQESGTFFNAQQILAQAGMWDEVSRQNLQPAEAVSCLEKKSIDGFFFTAGLPNPAIAELSGRLDIALIPLPSGLVFELANMYPFYTGTTIPGGMYSGVAAGIPALEINAILVAHQSLSQDDVAIITKTLFGTGALERLRKQHQQLTGLTRESVRRTMSIPLNEGARRALIE